MQNAVGLTTVNRLREYVADVRFTPEKYFALNKAAGIACNWVRAVERYARAYQWANPKSQSNQNQSLDRVRDMSRNPIMAIEQFEAGVRLTEQRQREAGQREDDAKRRISILERQLQQTNLILNALTPENVDWKHCLQQLNEAVPTLIGDSILYAAYVTYLVYKPTFSLGSCGRMYACICM